MKLQLKKLQFKSINWKYLTLFAIACFYIFTFHTYFGKGDVPADYTAYWTTGKIADEKGYSEIYDFNTLKSVQTQELRELGIIGNKETVLYSVGYFSFFIIPFQFLSRIDLVSSFRVWTIINLVIQIGYLAFFLRNTIRAGEAKVSQLNLLALGLVAYPVFTNLCNGQVNILLFVCAGEFIRCAVNKKPLHAGMWLGGLLLKPLLLIFIIPIFLIKHNWKVLTGFIVSSGIIVTISTLLSKFTGMKVLLDLWTKISGGGISSAPETMINWRMVGVNLNSLLNTSLGFVITGLGMALTFLAIYILFKRNPSFGSPEWVMVMLGVFSATLAIFWHSHHHMAMVLIPFLIYVASHKYSSEKMLFYWVTVTPAAWFGSLLVILIAMMFTSNNLKIDQEMIVAFSGFFVNLAVLIFAVRKSTDPIFNESA